MSTTPINYADYDFNRLVTQILNRLQNNPAWANLTENTYRSSTSGMLVELYAYVANLVLYYIERRAEESYLDTAQLRSSVINLVRLLNYNPRRMTSANGTLTFSIPTARGTPIVIPPFAECRTITGIKYAVKDGGTISGDTTSISLNAIQGELIQSTVSSSGALSQEVAINDTAVENTMFDNITVVNNDGSITTQPKYSNLGVFVDNGTGSYEQWMAVSSFASSTSDSKHFKVRTELDESLTIIFGDNVFGMAPVIGGSIRIKYIRTSGLAGNVYSSDKVTIIQTPIYDYADVKVTNLSVTNPEAFTDGNDAQTTEDIRLQAPNVFKTGDRAVTKDDFTTIIQEYGVPTVNVWGENEETPPNYTMFNRLLICLVMNGWLQPTAANKTAISQLLYAKSMMTVKYEFTAAKIMHCFPTVTARIKRGFAKSTAKDNINNALNSNFQLGSTAVLGGAVRISTLYELINALPEISYVHLTMKARLDITNQIDSNWQHSAYAYGVPILQQSVYVYVGTGDYDKTLIAIDNGSGAFTSYDSALFSNGTVDYATGYVGIDAVVPSGNNIWITYEQDNVGTPFDGDFIVGRDGICDLWLETGDIDPTTGILFVDE